jgi:hypothetical protein
LDKGMQIHKYLSAKQAAIAAGLLLLVAVAGFVRAQGGSPRLQQAPHNASPTAQAKSGANPADDFAGLTYTDEQKDKIGSIHQDIKARMDAVTNDDKLNADQKGAMLSGYQRMERGQVFKVLTLEQQKEVLKREHARQAAEKVDKNKQVAPR